VTGTYPGKLRQQVGLNTYKLVPRLIKLTGACPRRDCTPMSVPPWQTHKAQNSTTYVEVAVPRPSRARQARRQQTCAASACDQPRRASPQRSPETRARTGRAGGSRGSREVGLSGSGSIMVSATTYCRTRRQQTCATPSANCAPAPESSNACRCFKRTDAPSASPTCV
jgi:hypothetical protein